MSACTRINDDSKFFYYKIEVISFLFFSIEITNIILIKCENILI